MLQKHDKNVHFKQLPPKNFARDDKLAFQEWQDILQIDLHYPSVILPYHYKMKNEVRNFALANKNHLRWGCMVTKYPHFEKEKISDYYNF